MEYAAKYIRPNGNVVYLQIVDNQFTYIFNGFTFTNLSAALLTADLNKNYHDN